MSSPEEDLRLQYRHFSDMQVWPFPARMDVEGWLRNFTPAERPLAAMLAAEVTHYSERHGDALMLDAFRRISAGLLWEQVPARWKSTWNGFLERMTVVPIVGTTRGAESGYLMAYRSRQILGIPDKQILAHEHALDRLRYSDGYPVVFVDDVIVTGDQFLDFADQPRGLPGGKVGSYADLIDRREGETILCCMIGSTFGAERIHRRFPNLKISVGNWIDASYCISSDSCTLFDDVTLPRIRDLIRTASERAGIPARGPKDHFGYRSVGLLLSLHHNVPDTTIPILWWSENDWRPLIVRG